MHTSEIHLCGISTHHLSNHNCVSLAQEAVFLSHIVSFDE